MVGSRRAGAKLGQSKLARTSMTIMELASAGFPIIGSRRSAISFFVASFIIFFIDAAVC